MRPITQVVQMEYKNPQASKSLFVPVAVVCNTSDEKLRENVSINAARDLEWIKVEEPTERKAVMVGGGPSLADCLDDVKALKAEGGTIFAMNGASRFLTERGVAVDYQVIADAKDETAQLVDPHANRHLFASQASPLTFELAREPIVWHLEIGNVEECFPPERVRRGGYALIGGGAAVGNSALCLAYAMGYRELHIFGYDSCHRGDDSHAYPQPMNQFMPCVDVKWGGKTYRASVAMKAQAEKFVITAQALKQAGCDLHVYGDGLLQAMYLTPPQNLGERDKYILLWETDSYRFVSPGEQAVPAFLELVKPDGLIVDFGCGTGRAALALHEAGHEVYLIDFADNCRDQEALKLPFLEWDLTHPCPVRAPYGLCCDVMEHIPPGSVEAVICNIMASAETVFFQISTRPDSFGVLIGQSLHLTVRPHEWWLSLFGELGFAVSWAKAAGDTSQFVVKRKEQ